MPAGARQTVVLLAALGLCPLAALLIGDDPAGPLARGAALAGAERDLGLHVEPAVHAWALRYPALITAAGVFYIVAHIGVAGWALIWTWWLRRDAFPVVRDVFLATQVLTVALYALVPTAPPRLVEPGAFEDTLAVVWGGAAADSAHLLQSPYAAMPSGHVAFALVAGGTFACARGPPLAAGLRRALPAARGGRDDRHGPPPVAGRGRGARRLRRGRRGGPPGPAPARSRTPARPSAGASPP